jgi:hypothetical protein
MSNKDLTFHLFGDFTLEDSSCFLNKAELSEIDQYLPMIRDLERCWKERKLKVYSTLCYQAKRFTNRSTVRLKA